MRESQEELSIGLPFHQPDMPQRFLRPGITTSARFNGASWQAQSLYVRLLTLVDDYGRFEAHPMLLKSLAFPFNPEITCEQMLALLENLRLNNLAIFYEKEGKPFFQLCRWNEKARSHSKFPPHDGEGCKQMFSDVSKCSPPSSSPSPSPSPIPAAPVVPVEGKTTHPEHAAFIQGWSQNFKSHFGFDYVFNGGKDGRAVKELLLLGVLRIDLLEIAKKAWIRGGQPPKAFGCEKAASIHGFRTYINEIQMEIKNGTKINQRSNPRLEGVSRNPINNYATAKRRVEPEMASPADAPPEAGGA